jgi:hypothetical protein
MKKVNMDIAERCELHLRRWLRSAERFSEAAILRGLDFVNTRFSSVSASGHACRPAFAAPLGPL